MKQDKYYMKLYAIQILVCTFFIVEVVLNGITNWSAIFGIMAFLTTIYNSIVELIEGYNHFFGGNHK